MLFKVDPRIFEQYPGLSIGVLVAYGIDNAFHKQKAYDLLKEQAHTIARQMTADQISHHPYVTSWREVYRAFGANPAKHISSIENLLKKASAGQLNKAINPLVDLYNLISLTYFLPAGGEDLLTLHGDLELTIATQQEQEVLLLGETVPRSPHPGEIMYKDGNGAVCRRWNWKEADRTKLTEQTTAAILVLEALVPEQRIFVETAINHLAHLIKQYCGGHVTGVVVDAHNPEIAIKNGTSYASLGQLAQFDPSIAQQLFNMAGKTDRAVVQDVSQEHGIRLDKVKKMRNAGIDPWPQYKQIDATSQLVIDEFERCAETKKYALAGRLLSVREHGKAIFATIQDSSGKIQLYFRKDELSPAATTLLHDYLDIGDIIWCCGTSFRTKMGEITLKVTDVALLSKSLHPLPEKFHGIADVEVKYRQRYLDLIATRESRERFKKRSKIIATMRQVFEQYGCIEVETPMLHPIAGGAAARPFKTHHNALAADLYLRIAPELYLKRLIIGGFERVYEINRNFRNEGISTRHNPEFTSVEWYVAHHDYMWMMDFVEHMLKTVAASVCDDSKVVVYGEHLLDFTQPFIRMSMHDAVIRYSGCSASDLEPSAIDRLLNHHRIILDIKNPTWGYKLVALFEKLVEPHLIQPTFITEFPTEVSPLAKRNPANPAVTDRFELYCAGMEIANGFTELNDPFDQAQRFHEQAAAKSAGDAEAHLYDADFILALEHAMPPTVGSGIGIDRLVMLLTQTTSIKDVILFPTLRPRL